MVTAHGSLSALAYSGDHSQHTKHLPGSVSAFQGTFSTVPVVASSASTMPF